MVLHRGFERSRAGRSKHENPVRTLSGRKTQEDLSRSGKFNFTWDGRATNGRLVLPGVYLYQIAVEAESGEEQLRGSLSVVY